jgi:hypothetical protein
MSGKEVVHDHTIEIPYSPKKRRVIRTRDGSVYQFAEWPDSPRVTPEVRVSGRSGNRTNAPSAARMPESVKEVTGLDDLL